MEINIQEPGKEELIEEEKRGEGVSAWELYRRDPVLCLLKGHWHLKTSWIVGGVIVLSCAISFGLEALSGGFAHSVPLRYIIRLLLQTFVLFPLTALIYVSLPASILGLFETLKANSVIGAPREERSKGETYEEVLARLAAWQGSMWWTVSAWLLVGSYMFYRFAVIDAAVRNSDPLWLRVPMAMVYGLTIYVVFLSVVRLLVGWMVLNQVFSTFRIHLALWHPDGSAGLGILDEMLVKSTWLMLLMGMAVFAVHSSLLSGQPTIFSLTQALGLGLVYVGLTPLLVFGWLWLSRKAFVEARSAALRPLGQQLQRELQTILGSRLDEREKLKRELDQLEEMKRLYELTREAFPLWPATIVQVRRFFLVVVSLSAAIPILAFLVTIVNSIFGWHLPIV
ncbi:hypothetical protein KSF_097590 [Reticulibacter mediterranei]|uniref:Uncharacterized protein n=1 Tax=Reticulibacter mediterranei TaxID=2778369 RepID=A0A8J3J2S2_9CHLR|nr:hypothetical protein [Reticulibacter mediterranei]GHO99711.1 hypothetical protein KSF_097590 [Reticulibacter mediterranei]